MEWVENTGRTVDEAKERALDQLGVGEEEAEFEVVEEPRAGLFGRVRGEARVRARVLPTRPRPKLERRDRRRRRDDRPPTDRKEVVVDHETPAPPRESSDGAIPPERPPVDPQVLAASATQFVEGVVAAFGLDASVAVSTSDEAVELNIEGDEVGLLIGPRGQTMGALQDLTRMAVQRRSTPDGPRLTVDVGSYRERRHEALRRFAERIAEEVIAAGEPRALEPMSAVDRKVVHDAINEIDGVRTTSDGEEPFRRVIVAPD